MDDADDVTLIELKVGGGVMIPPLLPPQDVQPKTAAHIDITIRVIFRFFSFHLPESQYSQLPTGQKTYSPATHTD
jgi:hypothetical protein